MRKRVMVAVVIAMMLVGCGRQPKLIGNVTDWSVYDSRDCHVYYAETKTGCYSDGSDASNTMYDRWIEDNMEN